MCSFCDGILNKKARWKVRSKMANDNICEFVNDYNCNLCVNCDMVFDLFGYKIEDNYYIGVGYTQKIRTLDKEDVVISPFSEGQRINYCPMCGSQLSNDVVDFDNMKYNKIEIFDSSDK